MRDYEGCGVPPLEEGLGDLKEMEPGWLLAQMSIYEDCPCPTCVSARDALTEALKDWGYADGESLDRLSREESLKAAKEARGERERRRREFFGEDE